MVKIKICGVTNVTDALAAAELGADAVGLNFYKASPRYITMEKAREIIRELPPFIEVVGVFVNDAIKQITNTLAELGIHTFQWHGDRLAPSQDYNLNDLGSQLRQGLSGVTSWPFIFLPMMERSQFDEDTGRIEAMLGAMTEDERIQPDIIDSSRRKRIAEACGVDGQTVKHFLLQFSQIRENARRTASMSLWQKVKMLLGRLGPTDELQQTAAAMGIAGIIFPTDVNRLRVTAAFAVRDEESLHLISAYLEVCASQGRPPAAILVDAHVPGSYGGTGQTLPWELLADFSPGVPLILAGGLTPDNVARAIRLVRPYAVDVASGVESSPGQKDHEKMKRFIAEVKKCGL